MRSREEILKDVKRCMNSPGRILGCVTAECAGCDFELSHPEECAEMLYAELEDSLNNK